VSGGSNLISAFLYRECLREQMKMPNLLSENGRPSKVVLKQYQCKSFFTTHLTHVLPAA